jgi:hypothetical protein
MRRTASALWCGSVLKSPADHCVRVCEGLLFALHAQGWHAATGAYACCEQGRGACCSCCSAGLGVTRLASCPNGLGAEVPELCALILCCYALRVFHRVLCGLLQVATPVGSTRNLPPPTVSSQRHLPVNAFLDTTRARWITLELFGRPFPQIVSERDRTIARRHRSDNLGGFSEYRALSDGLCAIQRRLPLWGTAAYLSGAQGSDAAEPDVASSAACTVRKVRTASADLGAAIGHWRQSRAVPGSRSSGKSATLAALCGSWRAYRSRTRLPERPNREHCTVSHATAGAGGAAFERGRQCHAGRERCTEQARHPYRSDLV